jgi:hypothetical protein
MIAVIVTDFIHHRCHIWTTPAPLSETQGTNLSRLPREKSNRKRLAQWGYGRCGSAASDVMSRWETLLFEITAPLALGQYLNMQLDLSCCHAHISHRAALKLCLLWLVIARFSVHIPVVTPTLVIQNGLWFCSVLWTRQRRVLSLNSTSHASLNNICSSRRLA